MEDSPAPPGADAGSDGGAPAEEVDYDEQRWDSAGGNPTHATHSSMAEFAIAALAADLPEVKQFRRQIVEGVNLELHELVVTKDTAHDQFATSFPGATYKRKFLPSAYANMTKVHWTFLRDREAHCAWATAYALRSAARALPAASQWGERRGERAVHLATRPLTLPPCIDARARGPRG